MEILFTAVAGTWAFYNAYRNIRHFPPRLFYNPVLRTLSTFVLNEPTSTWSKQEECEAAAAVFSVIAGVKFVSEKDVQKQLELGKKVTPVEIKDVFYGRLSSSQNQVHDQQQQLYYVPDSAYDPQYDYDFTDYKGDDTNCTRGDYPYKRPAGWNRKAVKVIGKYEDDVWLGQQGWRDESSPGEWPVSYYGTKIENVPSIVAGGYDTNKCVRKAYGPGIYSTPDINVAEGYATNFNYKGVISIRQG
ncbi:uncharacterized protein LOC116289052 [Actinia tenebrosa]|uniref:Uncharacterized protein LOC116289052 n=1 Tax=Actinia tenebrosa TaxID=6105 RepID=A0A6P8HGW4_ACTTE|nr:uncharacterized protein LOC116289052 [Actinia tenebrosa]